MLALAVIVNSDTPGRFVEGVEFAYERVKAAAKEEKPAGVRSSAPEGAVRGVAGLVAEKRKPKRETMQERANRARLYGRLYLAQMGAHNRGDEYEYETLEMAMNEIKRLRIETGYYGSAKGTVSEPEKGPGFDYQRPEPTQ